LLKDLPPGFVADVHLASQLSDIVLRTHSEMESALWRQEKLGAVFFDAEEPARGMAGHVLRHVTEMAGKA